jgi:hypothetical protein
MTVLEDSSRAMGGSFAAPGVAAWAKGRVGDGGEGEGGEGGEGGAAGVAVARGAAAGGALEDEGDAV